MKDSIVKWECEGYEGQMRKMLLRGSDAKDLIVMLICEGS